MQVILLKPPTATEAERQEVERRFVRSHRVHRRKVEKWLRYLKEKSSRGTLPEGESVHDQFLSRTEAATSDPGLESLSDEDSGDKSEDRSEVGQGDMADEQPPTNTSACVPAHELEYHSL